MPISKKPDKRTLPNSAPTQEEKAIQAIIHKGGSVATDKSLQEEDAPKNVQLRLYPDQIEVIDQIIDRNRGQSRRRKQSRHSWLIEAIEEKIDRESRTE